MKALTIQAGPAALARIRTHGLRAQDIAVIPAAAGGPKGLILQKLDQWLFGQWLPSAPRTRSLIGASVGAWRMAAACLPNPAEAFRRLGELYCEQRYPPHPSPQLVSATCRHTIEHLLGDDTGFALTHPHFRLHVLAARGRGLLRQPQSRLAQQAGFGLAALANIRSRARLARHLARVVLSDTRDPVFWLKAKFDAFDTEFAPLTAANLCQALLASGTLPLAMEPVRDLPDAPSGSYWDGGLIDYHLALPYSRIAGNPEGGLVLYPHFGQRIVPGWLDKSLPWRCAHRGPNRGWLDNVIIISPSAAFLRTLPRAKLPDRSDFIHYGRNDDARVLDWKRAIAEGERLRDELAAFAERPHPELVQPL